MGWVIIGRMDSAIAFKTKNQEVILLDDAPTPKLVLYFTHFLWSCILMIL
jgi:hypothetical protein